MTRFIIATGLSLTSSAAFSHDGAHLHPHGVAHSFWGIAIGLAAVAAIVLMARAR